MVENKRENCDWSKLGLNYQFHYGNWHSEDSRQQDILYYENYLKVHNIYPKFKNDKVLEVGCGMGNLLLALKKTGYQNVSGFDIDDVQVNSCKNYDLNVKKCSAIEYFAEETEIYNSILALDVIEHMEKSEQISLLRAIYNHLTEDGFFVLTVPNAMNPLGLYFKEIDWTHYCSFSPTSLSFLLKNAGFHYYALRPTHQESAEVRSLKQPWINLFKAEFNIKDPILTPSIMAVCFKNKHNYDEYMKNTPSLMVFSPFLKVFSIFGFSFLYSFKRFLSFVKRKLKEYI